VAIRSCFYLDDEATIQQIRDDIATWDVDKAGSWAEWVAGIVKLYTRLDIVARDRTFHPSDKLFKLRSVLTKLDGEQERHIKAQVEIMVDQSLNNKASAKDLYEQCWSFVDRRMKLLEKTTTATKQTAMSVTQKVFAATTVRPRCN